MANSELENLFSCSFTEKVRLPRTSTFTVENEQSYMIGDLKIRKHSGLFWRTYKTKTCILLNNGYFLIYSSPLEGLSIYLPNIRNLEHRFSAVWSNDESKARCDIVMTHGRTKLGVSIKGHRSIVAAWRRGIICGHKGLPISEPHLTDESIWSECQSQLGSKASVMPLCSSSKTSLPLNNTLPKVTRKFSLAQRNNSSMVCLGLKTREALTLDANDSDFTHSRLFATTMSLSTSDISDHRIRSLSLHYDSEDDSAFISDSGMCSPLKEDQQMAHQSNLESTNSSNATEPSTTCDRRYVNWRELTMAAKLPILSAEILNFEAVFHRRYPSMDSFVIC